METLNKWTVEGKVIYLKKLDKDFSASIKIKSFSSLKNHLGSSILEIKCLLSKEVYATAIKNGLQTYINVIAQGHFETWCDKNNQKTMLIADDISIIKKISHKEV